MKAYYEHAGITIYHGDCREVLPTLPLGMVGVTDPPYGCGVKYGIYDDDPETYWRWFLPCLIFLQEHLRPLVFTHRNAALSKITGADWIGVWNKPGAFGSRIGNSCILPHWEPIFMFGIHGMGTKSIYTSDVFTYNPNNNGAGISDIGREKWKNGDFDYHPCPKPEGIYRDFITVFAQNSETICDPFMGSGTTLRAAKDLGRKAIGIEIEEKYCEIAAKRLSQEVFEFSGLNSTEGSK